MEQIDETNGTPIHESGTSENSDFVPARLTSEQIRTLKRGFPRRNDTPEQAAARSWHGMTLEAIADRFSEEQGRQVSVRVVRHHYKKLRAGSNPALPLGRDKSQADTAQRAMTIPAHANLRALTRVIWTLTQFSIPAIYKLYAIASELMEWKLVAIQNFRRIIKELGIEGIKNTPSPNLMERHSLRVLQHSIQPTEDSRNTWIILAAIEPVTGYINLATYKNPDNGASHGVPVAEIIAFIEETARRLALPIHQVELYGVAMAVVADLGSKLHDRQIMLGDEKSLKAEYSLPEGLNTAGKFCDFLSITVNAYNDKVAKSQLTEARKTIHDEFKRVAQISKGKWSYTRITRRYPETDGNKLMQFCNDHLKADDVERQVRAITLTMQKLK